jgi:hypothetical protein
MTCKKDRSRILIRKTDEQKKAALQQQIAALKEKALLPRLRVWLGLGLRRLAEGLLGGKAKAGHRF